MRFFFSFTSLRYDIHLRECRNGEAYKKRSGKRGWRGGVRSRKARQKRPAQNSERNVILNDNKAKVIIV